NVGNVRYATPPCDQFTVEFTFPRGLTTFDTSGGRGNCSVQMKIEYMATSVGVWTGLPCPLYTDNSTSAVRRAETFGVNSALGEIQVRCTRVTEDATDDKICDAVTWTALRSITLEAPGKRSGLALLAMRIRATDQLSGNLDQVSAVATGECIGYDRAGNYVNMVPGNPAWAFVDVLLGASNMNPVPRDQIDWPTIYDWAVDCDTWTNGAAKWSYNAIHDSRATVDSALRIIAATGRARYVFRDGKYTVVRDIPQTVPFQAFTPRNSWGWKSTRTFVKLPHALRCRWINPDLDWQEDELVVYMDGYNKNTATLFEQMDMMACTNKNQVFREARYHMAVAILRPVIYELQTDVEHIACKTGDLVQVAYDVPMWGINQARVDSVIYNSYGQVTGITVDTPLTTNAGKTYSIRIRYN
ncbi:MAG: hypothetical protein J0626_10900, partial [Rhodospirillaceae bacterium]|nr:hypothetical protein [Rhodospirillaceae bacterium]